MKRLACLLCPALVLLLAAESQAITIPTVPVGNAGNAGQVHSQGTFGAVAYDYRIGTTEVTNAQYAAFLNAKAATDPLSLYNTNMDSEPRGGITRSGSSGSYTYTLKANMGDKPVTFVSWYDAIRFANWLHNGQGGGDTEAGAYTLLGGTPTPSNGLSITRNSGAVWFLTSEDEWYKAALYDPTLAGGGGYWAWPTRSNTAPTKATANSVGDISNPGINVANFGFGAIWNDFANVTTVGSAGPLSESYYGTSDQAGNVAEWNEALINASFRGQRGGDWSSFTAGHLLPNQGISLPAVERAELGFRVATVPEPSTLALAALGIAGLFAARRRRRAASAAAALITFSLLGGRSLYAITIDTVPVGNPGNAGQLSGAGTPGGGYGPNATVGGVAYSYRIGTYEVTVGQYAAFLNAIGADDPYGLYNPAMATDLRIAGIARAGAPGTYTYSVLGSANHPITYVDWGDAVRFANWLHNGQPSGEGPGTTESGAYTLNGATTDADLAGVVRNPGATWFLPSESEWYKAAYYQPTSQGGDADGYWQYPMHTNVTPYSDQPPGAAPNNTRVANVFIDDSVANGYNDGYAVTGSATQQSNQNYLTDVGAYTSSPSYYGTFDQGGNAFEWNEAIIAGTVHGMRGGSWGSYATWLAASHRIDFIQSGADNNFGFRVATVPEPSTLALAALGIVGLFISRLRRCRVTRAAAVLITFALLGSTNLFAVTIPTVPVGNAGNTGELSGVGAGGSGPNAIVGGVAYNYRIGKYEVTNAQYAEFLNAQAASDPLALYNTEMGSNARGGITRSGSDGSYTYTTKDNMGNKPVNFVSWYDAIRFANWLHNGQGTGDTETGAYTLLGGTATPSNGPSITRNAGDVWFLTSEDEWYKAAYYQPAAQGGDSDNYWLYPTATNSVPTVATANAVGDISNPGANVVNYNYGADWNGLNGNVTTVGSAGPLSESFYGTSDQGGNVREWTETMIDDPFRQTRGSSWGLGGSDLALASSRVAGAVGTVEHVVVGFRVATVPEPSTFALAALGIVGVQAFARRRSRHASGV